MIIGDFDMQFVIGFLIKNEEVLLVKRIKKPWINKYNGLGGKIEEDEKPKNAFLREIHEEAGIKLKKNQTIYTGIVTWQTEEKEQYIRGMFSFVSYLSEDQAPWHEERETKEGLLAWKTFAWIIDKTNKEIADNIPFFLPRMLNQTAPHRFHCITKNKVLQSVTELPIPYQLPI